MNLRTCALAAVAALALTAAAACGDDDDDDAATSDPPATTTAAADESTTTTAAEPEATALVELTDADLGSILTSDGRTLYAFVPDGGNGASTCTGGCADTWPALVADGDVTVGDGLDQSLFTTTDGGQVVVDGWPLYFFANDAAPGDTNGQGVGGNWYVVGADGAMIQG